MMMIVLIFILFCMIMLVLFFVVVFDIFEINVLFIIKDKFFVLMNFFYIMLEFFRDMVFNLFMFSLSNVIFWECVFWICLYVWIKLYNFLVYDKNYSFLYIIGMLDFL